MRYRTLALLMIAAACSDGTGPTVPAVVTLQSSVTGPEILTAAQGGPRYRCEITLVASAAGGVGARWSGATFHFFVASDTVAPLNSTDLPAEQIQDAWGGDSIHPGETADARWGISAVVPFRMEMEFHYQSGGTSQTTAVKFDCGTSVALAQPGPTLSGLQLSGLTSTPEPGDTITVSWTAEAPARLFETAVALEGACDSTLYIPEGLETRSTRTIRLELPHGCRVGQPVTVIVAAIDAGFRIAEHAFAPSAALVDTTDPFVFVIDSLRGNLFVGQTLQFRVNARDNHRLRGVYWEVLPAGFRDSIVGIDSLTFHLIAIPIPAAWLGDLTVRIWAVDQSGNVSPVRQSAPGAYRIAARLNPAFSCQAVSGDLSDAVFDTKRGKVYLRQPFQRFIRGFSLATRLLTDSIPLPAFVTDIELTPGGDTLIALMGDSLWLGFIALGGASPALTVEPIPMVGTLRPRPHHARALADGRVFVASHGDATVFGVLQEFTPATKSWRRRTDAGDANGVGPQMGRSLDGQVVIFNGPYTMFQRYDLATDAFGMGRSSGMNDIRPVTSATGAVTTINGSLYAADLSYLRNVAVHPGLSAPPFTLSSDGATHYVIHWPDGVLRSRVSDGALLDAVLTPMNANFVRVTPSGDQLMVASAGPSLPNATMCFTQQPPLTTALR